MKKILLSLLWIASSQAYADYAETSVKSIETSRCFIFPKVNIADVERVFAEGNGFDQFHFDLFFRERVYTSLFFTDGFGKVTQKDVTTEVNRQQSFHSIEKDGTESYLFGQVTRYLRLRSTQICAEAK